MNGRHLVGWGVGITSLVGASSFGGCAPTVTVSKDDDRVGAAGEVTGVGGSGAVGGEATAVGGSGSGGRNGSGGGSGSIELMGGTGGRGVPTAGGTGVAGMPVSAGAPSVPPFPPGDCPCTRRQGALLNGYCPLGEDVSTVGEIGPEGGELSITGTASTIASGVPFRVRIPERSLSRNQGVVLDELSMSPPEELVDVSPIYSVLPEDSYFLHGAEVWIPYIVPSGPVPEEIAVYYSTYLAGPWERLADSYTNAGFLQATIGMGGYVLAAYPRTGDLLDCPLAPVLDFTTVDCGGEDAAKLLTKSCAKSFCHGQNFVVGLDLRPDDGLVARLLDVPAKFGGIPCADDVTKECVPETCPHGFTPLVSSSDPERSWMMQKLHDVQGCGDPMPTSPPLTPSEEDCFRAIIEAISALRQ